MPSGHNWQKAAVDSVQAKFDAFHKGLSDEERPVLDAVLAQAAARPAASGHAAQTGAPESIIFVGGHQIRFYVDPESWVTLNPQPIPPGHVTR